MFFPCSSWIISLPAVSLVTLAEPGVSSLVGDGVLTIAQARLLHPAIAMLVFVVTLGLCFLVKFTGLFLEISYCSPLLRLKGCHVKFKSSCLRKAVLFYGLEVVVLMRVVLQRSLQYCRIGTMFCAQSIWRQVRKLTTYPF